MDAGRPLPRSCTPRARRASVAAGLALAATLLAVFAAATPVLGHALLQSSDPAAGTTLPGPPSQVTISFGEPPDPKLSTIKVLDTIGQLVTTGPSVAIPGHPEQLRVPLGQLVPGWYTVAWRTVSAVDGHAAAGSFAFGVAGASDVGAGATPSAATGSAAPGGAPGTGPGAAVASAAGPSALAVAGRFLLYAGLVLLLGLALLAGLIAPPARGLDMRPFLVAWAAATLGLLLVVAAELSDIGVDLATALGTSVGSSILLRAAAWGVAGTGLLVLERLPARRGEGLGIVAVGAAAGMLADVANSHAAAGAYPPLDIAVQWVHVLAVGLWLGGLAGLLVAVRGRPDEGKARAVRRFSQAAAAGITLVVLSGLWRGVAEIGTLDALVGTDFGRLVIAKTGLLILLAGMGALNRWHSVPAAMSTLVPLRRVGSVELLVGATVVLLAAALVNVSPPVAGAAAESTARAPATPPPSTLPASPGPSPLVVLGHDFGTSVRLRLELSPGSLGPNEFRAAVTDYDTGAAVAAASVTLRFVLPARSDIGPSRLDLTPAGAPGVFAATGANLSLAGEWSITATVNAGTASVEVPLQVAVAAPPQQIDVNRATGVPTLYTVHLAGGRTVQVYLDPGEPGRNDFHATFFDARGNELAVTGVTIFAAPTGSTPQPLDLRTLEPGHVVATLDVTSGPTAFSVIARAPDGTFLAADIDITPGT